MDGKNTLAMKTIYLKCEVPDEWDEDKNFLRVEGREVPGGDVVFDDIEITEINLPTDEEINALFPMHENPRPYQKQTTTMKRNAAKKIIKQIEKQ